MGQGRARDESSNTLPSPEAVKAFIREDNACALVRSAETVGRELAQAGLKTSQIRNVFGTVRRIQLNWDVDPARAFRDAILLKPKLAYFAKREGKGMLSLNEVLQPALDTLAEAERETEADRLKRERFMRFADFFEAIVAYHKKYGGKE